MPPSRDRAAQDKLAAEDLPREEIRTDFNYERSSVNRACRRRAAPGGHGGATDSTVPILGETGTGKG
jgi:hypothetical protein